MRYVISASIIFILLSGCQASLVPRGTLGVARVEEQDAVLKDMNLHLDRPAVQAEIEKRRTEYMKLKGDQLSAANRSTRAGFEQVVASGGFNARLQRRLTELRSAPPALTVGGRAQQTLSIAEVERAIQTIAFCTKPLAYLAAETVTPGQLVEIDGCHFGGRAGAIQLTGPFPGGPLTLAVSSWTDTVILATVPAVTGVPDGPAQVIVSPPGMPAADPVETQFVATRTTDLLYPVQYATCDRKTQSDFCGYIQDDPGREAFWGHHWSRGTFFGVGGSDRYYASLKNGWVIMPIPSSVFINWNGYTSCSQWWSNDGGHVSSVIGFEQGSPIVDGTINWWVDANCSGVAYEATILLTGPLGLPYY